LSVSTLLPWIVWDPPRDLFVVPWFNRSIAWYGVLFAFGFLVGYFVMVYLLQKWLKQEDHSQLSGSPRTIAAHLTDRMIWVIVLGTIIGARLGHVFFYDWSMYRHYPLDILKVWEGGLASHGGAIGVFLGLLFFRYSIRKEWPRLTLATIADLVVIPTAFVGCCIRIGNFFNQEILGTPSTVPWSVVFGHPLDGSAPTARHPVQLYESVYYLAVFVFLMWLAKRKTDKIGSGLFTGWFFSLVFLFRIGIETFKNHQYSVLSLDSPLEMGQWLSIPFALVGLVLLCRVWKRSATA